VSVNGWNPEVAYTSARDFEDVVLPQLRHWLPQGEVLSVERHTHVPALAVVDQLAGIDYWLVADTLLGLASRVQYRTARDSFTVRSGKVNGARTELAKRTATLAGEGVGPHYTVQGYVAEPGGRFLLGLVVRTADLFAFMAAHPELVQHRRNLEDGTRFDVVWATDLEDAGVPVWRTATLGEPVERRNGVWRACSLRTPELAHQLLWVHEDVYVEQDALDRATALECAVRVCSPAVHSREEMFSYANSFYAWLRKTA